MKGTVQELEPVFRKWSEINHQYVQREGEPGFYYTERCSVGFLAAAAWLSGGMALEAFVEQKRSRDDRESLTRGRKACQ